MNNTRNNKNMKSHQELVECCINWTNKAEEIISCPVCHKVRNDVVICNKGHHICQLCSAKLTIFQCPTCSAKCTNATSFLVDELSPMLNNIMITLNDLRKCKFEQDTEKSYRELIKVLMTKLSTFLTKTNKTLNFFGNYLRNPYQTNDKNELECQLQSLTEQFENLKFFMNTTNVSLKLLKHQR